MISSFLLVAALWLTASINHVMASRQLQDNTLNPVCDSCWCVPDGGTDSGTCPSDTSGIYQSFPDSYPTLYTTFVETSAPITLQTSDGSSDCFPFADAIGALSYEESTLPQCVLSTAGSSASSDNAVCAYKFASAASDSSDCPNRQYELVTYASIDAVSADANAMMIHSGACGVCSNAQDLAVRMSTLDSLQSASITCATQFAFGGTFSSLVSCYETVGFTDQCASLWANFAAANAQLCAGDCAGQTSNLFGDPPLCELGSCLSCSKDFQAEFDELAGLYKSPYNAGFNVDIAYPCSSFTRIATLDPCSSGGAVVATEPTISPSPTSEPVPASTGSSNTPAPSGSSNGESGGVMNVSGTSVTLLLSVVFVVVSVM
ncbi:hypothetical protein MPSEU_000642500 [Mayamaea pseudoterrestris]|nr:hypothetical protein MPSEU_000642500 [Mayamaea pseudoterrestris]